MQYTELVQFMAGIHAVRLFPHGRDAEESPRLAQQLHLHAASGVILVLVPSDADLQQQKDNRIELNVLISYIYPLHSLSLSHTHKVKDNSFLF